MLPTLSGIMLKYFRSTCEKWQDWTQVSRQHARRRHEHREIWVRPSSMIWSKTASSAPKRFDFAAEVNSDCTVAFKRFGCIAAHWEMGALLGDSIRDALAAWLVRAGCSHRLSVLLALITARVVAVGTPTGQYSQCDVYADALGDAAQDWWSQLLSKSVQNIVPSGYDHSL